ncbi:PcfJ domain-containing protein_gp140 [Bacillus phage vB_BceM_WH1]|nr:PcfJ domain-containing protein_gp140 [Bacillus phage vB_BceM_WH1]
MTKFAKSFYIVGNHDTDTLPVRKYVIDNIRRDFDLEEVPHEAVGSLAVLLSERDARFRVNNGQGKLFCSCGYQGDAVTVFEKVVADDAIFHVGMLDEEREAEEKKTFEHNFYDLKRIVTCPECGSTEHEIVNVSGVDAVKNPMYLKIYHNENGISLSYGIQSYYFNPNVEKLGTKLGRARITFSYKTNMFYFVRGGKVRNISYGTFPSNTASGEFYDVFQHANYNEEWKAIVKEFKETIIKHMGAFIPEELVNLTNGHNLILFMASIVCPHLTILPFKPDTHGLRDGAKVLRKLPLKKKAVTQFLNGPVTKAMTPYVNNQGDIRFFAMVTSLVEDPNYRLTLLKTYKEYCDKHIRNNWGTDRISSVKSFDMVVNEMKNYDFPQEAIDWLKSLHPTDASMYHAMVRMSTEPVKEWNHEKREMIDTGEKKVNLSSVTWLTRDSHRMYQDIIQALPGYDLRYSGNMRETHDRLTRDYGRVKQAPRTIPYSEDERTYLTASYGGYDFVLPELTTELVECGQALDICVGGYGNEVAEKRTLIIFVKKEDKYVACIEVTPDGNMSQAKGYGNNRFRPLADDVIDAIAHWANNGGVSLSTYDMNSHKRRLEEKYAHLFERPEFLVKELGNPEESVRLEITQEMLEQEPVRAEAYQPEPNPFDALALEPAPVYGRAPVAANVGQPIMAELIGDLNDDLPF